MKNTLIKPESVVTNLVMISFIHPCAISANIVQLLVLGLEHFVRNALWKKMMKKNNFKYKTNEQRT